jgi:hypothetical protein
MASRRRQTGRPCSLWCPRPIRRRYRNRPTFCSHERAVPGLERNVRGRPLPRKEETSACDDCSPRWRPARKKLGRRRHGATLNFLSERRIHGKRGRLTHRVDTSSRAFVCTGARRCKGKKVANHATAKIFRSCGGASLFDSPLDSWGAGTLAHAALTVAVAFLLPASVALILEPVMAVATIAGLLAWTRATQRRNPAPTL